MNFTRHRIRKAIGTSVRENNKYRFNNGKKIKKILTELISSRNTSTTELRNALQDKKETEIIKTKLALPANKYTVEKRAMAETTESI